ncbi:MAG: deaminase [Aquificae bacterium]|nr:deaminase [Aquificota bacterium]
MKEIRSDRAPKPVGPYSQAVLVGNTLFLSGQIGIDPEKGKLVPGLKNQVRQIFKNVEAILQEAGFSKKDIVKVVVYLVDITRFGELNEVYEEFFSDVEVKPARVTVGVKELPLCAEVEIEVTAVRE